MWVGSLGWRQQVTFIGQEDGHPHPARDGILGEVPRQTLVKQYEQSLQMLLNRFSSVHIVFQGSHKAQKEIFCMLAPLMSVKSP